MADRGAVHVFRSQWTTKDPQDPTKRIKKTSGMWSWSFWLQGLCYRGSGNFRAKGEARAAGEKRRQEIRAQAEVKRILGHVVVSLAGVLTEIDRLAQEAPRDGLPALLGVTTAIEARIRLRLAEKG